MPNYVDAHLRQNVTQLQKLQLLWTSMKYTIVNNCFDTDGWVAEGHTAHKTPFH